MGKLVLIETGRTEGRGEVNLEPQLSRLWLAEPGLIIFKTQLVIFILKKVLLNMTWWCCPHRGKSHVPRSRKRLLPSRENWLPSGGNRCHQHYDHHNHHSQHHPHCHQARTGRHQVAISIIAINTTINIGMIAIITINIKYKTYFLGCMILRQIGIYKKPKKGGDN